jgi:hypothetical protein
VLTIALQNIDKREQQGRLKRLAQREKNIIAMDFAKLRDKVE